MIGVIGRYFVQPDKTVEFEAIIQTLTEKSQMQEPGTHVYRLFKEAGKDTRYVLIEHYRDRAARDAHWQSDYVRHALAALEECLIQPPRLEILDSV